MDLLPSRSLSLSLSLSFCLLSTLRSRSLTINCAASCPAVPSFPSHSSLFLALRRLSPLPQPLFPRRWTFWRRGQPAADNLLLGNGGKSREAVYIFPPFDSYNGVCRFAQIFVGIRKWSLFIDAGEWAMKSGEVNLFLTGIYFSRYTPFFLFHSFATRIYKFHVVQMYRRQRASLSKSTLHLRGRS